MLEFLESGAVAATKGLFVPVPNLPNSFTEDYTSAQSIGYKNGRFILSVLNKIFQVVTITDFLINPNDTNKLGVSLNITPLRVDNNTEDRIITVTFNKILNTLTGAFITPNLGNPLDNSFPTGLFQIDDIFPMAQLINIGDQVAYTGAVIAESVLLANGLPSLTLNSDGLKFVEAFLKGVYLIVPSQSGGISSVILPYNRPRVTVISSPLGAVTGLFDGVETITSNLYNVFLKIDYSLTIRMAITPDRVTVSTT